MSIFVGDLIEAKVDHPTLGQHTFYPKSSESSTIDRGGLRTNDDENQVTANGNIWQLNLVRGHFEMVVSNDENIQNDADFVTKLAGSKEDGEWTISHTNGAIYGLTGRPVGSIQPDLNVGTFTMKVAGKVTKISG